MKRLENREPGVHVGPHNVVLAEWGEDLGRVVEATAVEDRNRVGWIERALEFVDEWLISGVRG